MFVVGKGEYLMYKSRPGEDLVRSLVVPVPSRTTAGVYVFSSLYGNVVVGPTMMRQRSKEDRSCDPAVQAELRRHAETLFPALKDRGALKVTDSKSSKKRFKFLSYLCVVSLLVDCGQLVKTPSGTTTTKSGLTRRAAGSPSEASGNN